MPSSRSVVTAQWTGPLYFIASMDRPCGTHVRRGMQLWSALRPTNAPRRQQRVHVRGSPQAQG
eukprot:347842-Chlamydomonas_euryale.AAC.1